MLYGNDILHISHCILMIALQYINVALLKHDFFEEFCGFGLCGPSIYQAVGRWEAGFAVSWRPVESGRRMSKDASAWNSFSTCLYLSLVEDRVSWKSHLWKLEEGSTGQRAREAYRQICKAYRKGLWEVKAS